MSEDAAHEYLPREVATREGRGRCAIALVPLAAGTICAGFSGAPYAAVPLPSQRSRYCAACFKQAPEGGASSLLRCSKCRWARYCSRGCQTRDWALHKRECACLADAASPLHKMDEAAASDCLLAGRCLWRRRAAAASAGADDLAFDALEPGAPTAADVALGTAAATAGLLPPGPEAAAAAAALVGAFRRNNFGVLNSLHFLVGAGCYPPAALLNHSCDPTCVLAFDGCRVEVRTLRAVEAGEELTHSYVELCAPTARRRESLQSTYGFECACRRCAEPMPLPGGEDVDGVMEAPSSSAAKAMASGAGARRVHDDLTRASALLAQAQAEEDDEEEMRLTRQALALRREHCHRWSTLRYEAEGRALSVALATGEMEMALECCRAVVAFLEVALSHIPLHPILSLQRFTLSDLELASGNDSAAREQMALTAAAMRVTHTQGSELRRLAAERLNSDGEPAVLV